MLYSARFSCLEADWPFVEERNCDNVTADELDQRISNCCTEILRSDWEDKKEFSYVWRSLESHYRVVIQAS